MTRPTRCYMLISVLFFRLYRYRFYVRIALWLLLIHGVLLFVCSLKLPGSPLYNYFKNTTLLLDSAEAGNAVRVSHFLMLSSTVTVGHNPSTMGDPLLRDIALTVVTKEREGRSLFQVGSALYHLGVAHSYIVPSQVVLCSVDEKPAANPDVTVLEHLYKFKVTRKLDSPTARRSSLQINDFEMEKYDYLFCMQDVLQKHSNASMILMLEDDALPETNFFSVLTDLIQRRLPHRSTDFGFVKLYHPVRVNGYFEPEINRVPELLAVCFLVSLFSFAVMSLCMHSLNMFHFGFMFVNIACVMMIIGRPTVLRMLSVHPYLHILAPYTECCTPAMLYSRPGADLVYDVLDRTPVERDKALDVALFKFYQSSNIKAFSLQPSIVSHIGYYSSLHRYYVTE